MNNHLRYLKFLLEQEWEPDRSVRDQTVPEPEFIVERIDEQQQDMTTGDYVVIQPRSVDGAHALLNDDKRRRYGAYILCRSGGRRLKGDWIDGEERVLGTINDTTREQEQWGGMTGEVEYILDTYADGGPDYGLTIPRGDWGRVDAGFGVTAVRIPIESRRIERAATAL